MKLSSYPKSQFTIITVFLLFLTGQALSQNKHLSKEQLSLALAENNFAAQSVAKNIKSAFLQVLDEQSIVFRPQPINGRWAYHIDQRPDSTYLFWQPELVDISAGGDFGYSTGPWYTRRSKFNENGRKGFGNYVTIWSKDKNGAWHVLLDKGVNYSNLGERKITLEGTTTNHLIQPKKVALDEIMSIDSKSFKGNEIDYYNESTLFFQHWKWPFRYASDSLTKEFTNYETWEPLNGKVAPYGDMAYTYGQFKGFINGKVQEGYYLRIWKKQQDNNWKIVLDLRTEN